RAARRWAPRRREAAGRDSKASALRHGAWHLSKDFAGVWPMRGNGLSQNVTGARAARCRSPGGKRRFSAAPLSRRIRRAQAEGPALPTKNELILAASPGGPPGGYIQNGRTVILPKT